MQYNKEDTLEQRFSRYITIYDSKDCIIWKYSKISEYGVFGFKKKIFYAHRASYIIFKGEIPKGFYICHHCDNPSCVNPKHLYAGTAADNHFDMRLAKVLKKY